MLIVVLQEDRVARFIQEQKIDILGVQESTGGGLKRVAKALGYYCTAGTNANGRWGCALLSRYPILSAERITDPDDVGWDGKKNRRKSSRLILCTLDIHSVHVQLVIVHLNHARETHRLDQLAVCRKGLASEPDLPRFWLGDFNVRLASRPSFDLFAA